MRGHATRGLSQPQDEKWCLTPFLYCHVVCAITFVAGVIIALLNVGYTEDLQNQVTLTLKMDKSQYSITEDIVLQVTLENLGKDPIKIPAVMMPDHHSIKLFVVNDKGQQKQIQYEFKLKWLDKTIDLLPGYFWGRSFNLKELYTLDKGKFKIRATYDTNVAKTLSRSRVDTVHLESAPLEIELK